MTPGRRKALDQEHGAKAAPADLVVQVPLRLVDSDSL